MWVASKDQLVIKSPDPYCSKLTAQNLLDVTKKIA